MEEWAHSPRLAEKSLHDGQMISEGGTGECVVVKAVWNPHCQNVRGEEKEERMVGTISACADANHFICGIETQTKRPASASNGPDMIGSLRS